MHFVGKPSLVVSQKAKYTRMEHVLEVVYAAIMALHFLRLMVLIDF